MKQDSITVQTSNPTNASVRPPGSKSITNRALVCAALADGNSTLTGVLDSEDTQVMREALASIGFEFSYQRDACLLEMQGLTDARSNESPQNLYIANSGTTVRFLTSMLALADVEGAFRLHGTPRMHERPIIDLINALRQLGADVVCENDNACPPVIVRGKRCDGGTATVKGDISSQYLSGLLMAAPAAAGEVVIEVDGPLVSKPYVTMTMEVMRAFGATIDATDDLTRFVIPADSRYVGTNYDIEPDASAASYWFAAAAVAGGEVIVEGLSRNSLQGDVLFCDCLEQMGCDVEWRENIIIVRRDPQTPLKGITTNMKHISDTVQTLGVVALFADGPTVINDVANIRHKETDRLAAMATELRKFGARVEEREDGLTIHPPKQLTPATVDTYDDHRMAMSFAIAGLRIEGVVINDPGCTAKTYPEFFEVLAGIRG